MLESNHRLESAPDHTLGIEGHRFGIHHLGKTLVLHHLRVDAVASGARLVDDIGEHYGLTGLLLDATREGCSLSPLDVVGDAFAELQRAVLAPDLARLGRHAPVGCKLLLRNRHDKSIDVAHGNAPLVEDHTARDKVTREAGDWVAWTSCGEDAWDAPSTHLFFAALLLHNDHPADAEAVGDHAEALGEKRLAERHSHLSAVGERLEH